MAATQAAVLGGLLAALFALAQTIGARFGLSARDIGGSLASTAVAASAFFLILELLLASAALRPDLTRFMGFSLPVVDWASRPELAYGCAAGLVFSIGVGVISGAQAARLLRPGDAAAHALRRASKPRFIDYLVLTGDLAAPPEVDSIEIVVTEEGTTFQAPASDTRSKRIAWLRTYEDAKREVERGPVSANPFEPTLRILRMLAQERDTAELVLVWNGLNRALTGWANDEDSRFEWLPGWTRSAILEWQWLTLEEMVLLCLAAGYERGSIALLETMRVAQEAAVSASPARWQPSPVRSLSNIANHAIAVRAMRVVSTVIDLYRDAAREGLSKNSQALYDYGVLGLGWLAETTASLPLPARSIISENNEGSYQRTLDPCDEAVGELWNLTTSFERGEMPTVWPQFHFDSLMLGFTSTLDAAVAGREETALKAVRAIADLTRAGVADHGNSELFDRGCWEIRAIARRLKEIPENSVTKRMWESIEWTIVDGALKARGWQYQPTLDRGRNVLVNEVLPTLPEAHQDALGQLAFRSFLEFGHEALRDLHVEFDNATGRALPGWYF